MKKGFDYTGVTVSFRCHDGEGNYVMHKRSKTCRDEQGAWDFGGGGVKFNEPLEDALAREVKEEYGANVISFEFLGFRELFREHDGQPTHWVRFNYEVLVNPAQVINNEPDKLEEIKWVRLDNLPQPVHPVVAADFE